MIRVPLPFIKKHKILSLVVLSMVSIGGYFLYQAYNPLIAQSRYVLAAVETGSVSTTISGT